MRVASRRVGLVDVLWHDFHQSPSRRPEQREQLQWPSRLHLCGGGATTAAETARWRRVGTRVDWSCSRRCGRTGFCTLGLGSCLARLLINCLLRLGWSAPFAHLQSASVANLSMFSGRMLTNQHANATERRAHLDLKRCARSEHSTVFTSAQWLDSRPINAQMFSARMLQIHHATRARGRPTFQDTPSEPLDANRRNHAGSAAYHARSGDRRLRVGPRRRRGGPWSTPGEFRRQISRFASGSGTELQSRK